MCGKYILLTLPSFISNSYVVACALKFGGGVGGVGGVVS